MVSKIFLVLFLSCLLLGCFAGVQRQGSVVGYSHNIVRTQGGSFQIGLLPSTWLQQKIKYRALLFLNRQDQSTITVDSWCQGAYDDRSLTILTNQLFKSLENLNIVEQTTDSLDNRDCLSTEATGTMDGRSVLMTTSVLKMNNCVFDFVYVTVPEQIDSLADFKNMVQGFKYISGPSAL